VHAAARAKVNSRAQQLLMSLLNDEQARDYREHGWFEVRGSSGGRWRIRNRGQAGNVDLMPEIGNEREASFCCHLPYGHPDADSHVAQMFALVTDEDDFRRTANVSYTRPGLDRETARWLRPAPVHPITAGLAERSLLNRRPERRLAAA
jgi:hypothetical protein